MADFGIGEAMLLAEAAGAAEAGASAATLGELAGAGILGSEAAGAGIGALAGAAPEAAATLPTALSSAGAEALPSYATRGLQAAGTLAQPSAAQMAAYNFGAPAEIIAQSAPTAYDVAGATTFPVSASPSTAGIQSLGGTFGDAATVMQAGQPEYMAAKQAIESSASMFPSVDPRTAVGSMEGLEQLGNPIKAALLSDAGYGPLASPAELNAASSPSRIPDFLKNPVSWYKGLSEDEKFLAKAGAGLGGLALLKSGQQHFPGQKPYTGPLSRFRYNPDTYNPGSSYLSMYRPYYAAQGGITNLGGDLVVGDPAPTPTQMMARGGISDLGSYSDGGRMLKGPGDGMSDSIPASIADKRPARLAEGEFVVPADVVSHLGNGSTDAGAKQLYSMMDRVRSARTGTKKQGRQIKPHKFMPA